MSDFEANIISLSVRSSGTHTSTPSLVHLSIPKDVDILWPDEGSVWERYSQRIGTSFSRTWAACESRFLKGLGHPLAERGQRVTGFPTIDWIQNILGYQLDFGSSLHAYQRERHLDKAESTVTSSEYYCQSDVTSFTTLVKKKTYANVTKFLSSENRDIRGKWARCPIVRTEDNVKIENNSQSIHVIKNPSVSENRGLWKCDHVPQTIPRATTSSRILQRARTEDYMKLRARSPKRGS